VSKFTHDGGFSIEKFRVSPSASFAAGVKEYGCPSVTCSGGEPLIVGTLFDAGGDGTSVDSFEPPPLLQPAMTIRTKVQRVKRIAMPETERLT
jgi:hypothetical protein